MTTTLSVSSIGRNTPVCDLPREIIKSLSGNGNGNGKNALRTNNQERFDAQVVFQKTHAFDSKGYIGGKEDFDEFAQALNSGRKSRLITSGELAVSEEIFLSIPDRKIGVKILDIQEVEKDKYKIRIAIRGLPGNIKLDGNFQQYSKNQGLLTLFGDIPTEDISCDQTAHELTNTGNSLYVEFDDENYIEITGSTVMDKPSGPSALLFLKLPICSCGMIGSMEQHTNLRIDELEGMYLRADRVANGQVFDFEKPSAMTLNIKQYDLQRISLPFDQEICLLVNSIRTGNHPSVHMIVGGKHIQQVNYLGLSNNIDNLQGSNFSQATLIPLKSNSSLSESDIKNQSLEITTTTGQKYYITLFKIDDKIPFGATFIIFKPTSSNTQKLNSSEVIPQPQINLPGRINHNEISFTTIVKTKSGESTLCLKNGQALCLQSNTTKLPILVRFIDVENDAIGVEILNIPTGVRPFISHPIHGIRDVGLYEEYDCRRFEGYISLTEKFVLPLHGNDAVMLKVALTDDGKLKVVIDSEGIENVNVLDKLPNRPKELENSTRTNETAVAVKRQGNKTTVSKFEVTSIPIRLDQSIKIRPVSQRANKVREPFGITFLRVDGNGVMAKITHLPARIEVFHPDLVRVIGCSSQRGYRDFNVCIPLIDDGIPEEKGEQTMQALSIMTNPSPLLLMAKKSGDKLKLIVIGRTEQISRQNR